jgi:hypothetical protein
MLLPALTVPPLDNVQNMVCANITHHWHTSAAWSVMVEKILQKGVSGFLDKKVTFYIHKQYVYIPKQIHVDKYISCANRGKHHLCHLKSYVHFLWCNATNSPDINKFSKYHVYTLFICITKEVFVRLTVSHKKQYVRRTWPRVTCSA